MRPRPTQVVDIVGVLALFYLSGLGVWECVGFLIAWVLATVAAMLIEEAMP